MVVWFMVRREEVYHESEKYIVSALLKESFLDEKARGMISGCAVALCM